MLCSIIIVCKNNLPEVKFTMQSLIEDKFVLDTCECIIVDDSQDDEILKYIVSLKAKHLKYCRGDGVSLYTAMNIGIKKSKGLYLWFLNSGDRKSVDFDLSKIKTNDADLIYGNTKYNKNGGTIYNKTWPTFHLANTNQLKNSLPCHQSILFKREFILSNKILYNAKLHISADYQFIQDCVKRSASIYYLPHFISEFTLGGISNHYNSIKSLLQHSYELRITRNLNKVEYFILTIKLCKKLLFKKP